VKIRAIRYTQMSKAIFILPTAVVILVLSLFPLVFSLILTFSRWHLSRLQEGIQFIGLENYLRLIQDQRLWGTAKTTLIFVFFGVSFQYLLGLGLAILLNQKIKARSFFRVSFLIPMMLTPVAVAYMGKMMFNETMGPLNDISSAILGVSPPWLTDSTLALVSVMIVDTWQWTPFMMLILLAGLVGIPEEAIEAAIVDGASNWQVFRYVTFPLLIPVSSTVILIRALEMFKVIDIITVLTGGGPGTATESVTLYTYYAGIKNFDLSYASTVAYALLVIVVIFATIYSNTSRRIVNKMGLGVEA